METTDGRRWTQIKRRDEQIGNHPAGKNLSGEKSVCICVHLWFRFPAQSRLLTWATESRLFYSAHAWHAPRRH